MNKQYIFITREQLGSLDFEEIRVPLNDFLWSKDSSETFYTFTDIPNCIQNIITEYNNKCSCVFWFKYSRLSNKS